MKNNWLFWAVIFGLLATGVGVVIATRGFRNNNPGNLRAGVPWVGSMGADADGYAVFDTLENGIRALGIDLRTKLSRGLNTIRSIMAVYAPQGDNNPTEAYTAFVSDRTGIDPDAALTVDNIPAVAEAIIHFETGHSAPDAAFAEGMNRALNA